MSKIVVVEYYSMKDNIVTTDKPTQTTTLFEPVFYILDNGMEIADGCVCEECNMLRFDLLTESQEEN